MLGQEVPTCGQGVPTIGQKVPTARPAQETELWLGPQEIWDPQSARAHAKDRSENNQSTNPGKNQRNLGILAQVQVEKNKRFLRISNHKPVLTMFGI